MSAGGEELSPLVQGGCSWSEEDVEFFKQAEAAGLARDVVACQVLLEEVPADGEALALPSELVNVSTEGGAWFALVLLLHIIYVPVVPLPERPPRQPCVGLLRVVVARVGDGDGGLVDHSWCVALPRKGAGWLVLAVATLVDDGGRPAPGDHLVVVLCQHLRHVCHRSVAHLHCVGVEGAPLF